MEETIGAELIEMNDDTSFSSARAFPSLSVNYLLDFATFPSNTDPYRTKLALGAHPFGNESGFVEGAIVTYNEVGDRVWSSAKDSGDQTGSKFEIEEFTVFDFFGDDLMIIKASFDCILYNDAGDTIRVTGGKFRGEYFGSY